MKKILVLTTAAASGLFAVNASAMDILARVISSTPVVQQVSVPQQVCTTQPMITQAPPSGAGAVMGALAGGAMGNAIGDGGGRALATMIGLVGGAMVGNNIEGNRNQVQNVQQCGTQTSYQNRTTHYNVVYEYADKQHSIQMPNDPGPYVRLQVTPVGALPSLQAFGQPGYAQPQQAQPVYGQPAYGQPAYGQPMYNQPVYSQPVYSQPVYVQPAPVVAYPGYYSRPYYPPVGLSLNFGYSRGGHGHGHRHWR
ncbi:glycine zipper 2TM domain-containing protein [Polaromonas sp.]|uniref:glycine zipper 2TM domain-containing protein n=1 Tax=Polaromonas sp. TaxID=1869339 RepID=UPI003750FE4C